MLTKKVPVIHQTDCFHNHADPDDHWDLASQFALAYTGAIDLKGILIDYPPTADVAGTDCGDPAIAAVNQLNFMCGQFAPVAVGNALKIHCDEDLHQVASMTPLNSGLSMIFRLLEEASEPVAIHIVGSARDIAVASMMRPELFKEKCKAVYLNAGTAVENLIEYNVKLDPYSYSKIFKLPCPLYWMPCFHELAPQQPLTLNTHGTYWRFCQKEVLPYLSENLQKYFAYALGRVTENRWLSYLKYPLNQEIIDAHSKFFRNMWCTAGFLHTAGKTVTVDGKIVYADTPGIQPVFDFMPIAVTCDDNGRTSWTPQESDQRFIFRILDTEQYEAAMTKALRELLSCIP